MLKGIFIGAAAGVILASLAFAEQVRTNPIVIESHHVTTSQALRDMKPEPWRNISKVMPEHDHNLFVRKSRIGDPVAQTEVLSEVGVTKGLSFDGIYDNQGGGYVPPDTNAAVGLSQVVETVNIAFAVYDKTTGNLISGPTNIQTLYKSLGSECATGQLSDPVATWDKVAQRWVITMIAFNSSFTVNEACVAVSTSADATGTYHLYAFQYKGTLPDYPKLGVWPDAYYLTTDSFPGGGFFSGAESCALDRTNMLAGNAATAVCFQLGSGDFSMLPADADGSTQPPSGAPNYEADLSSGSKPGINLYQFHVDFSNPKNSTFTGPTLIPVASYSDACGGGACIPQPSPGEVLDSLSGRLMYRLAYRNYGDHESLVATHSVTPTISGPVSAARWYEVRSPGSSPVLYQQGTFQASIASLWMASIGQDKAGDIALGFSGSSSKIDPSIAYTGRIPSDPLGKLESAIIVLKGTGVQENSFNRWGDYSSMQIDPVDDCTFWYTQEYYKTSGSFNFNTHINSFKFKNCQ